jgi:hypothetical protein
VPILANQRHELFAQEIAKGKSATEAYVLAGYQPSRKNASRLRAKEDVVARLAELQAVTARSAEITIESICRELDEANAVARERGQAAAMVSASALRAKLAGLMVEKVEITSSIDSDFDNCETHEDIADAFGRHWGEGYDLTPEQRAEFGELLKNWVAAIEEYLAGCTAKPVQPAMSGRDLEAAERKRLGLAPRRLINGQR